MTKADMTPEEAVKAGFITQKEADEINAKNKPIKKTSTNKKRIGTTERIEKEQFSQKLDKKKLKYNEKLLESDRKRALLRPEVRLTNKREKLAAERKYVRRHSGVYGNTKKLQKGIKNTKKIFKGLGKW